MPHSAALWPLALRGSRMQSLAVLALVVLAHGGVFLLMQGQVQRTAVTLPTVLTVSLFSPEAQAPAQSNTQMVKQVAARTPSPPQKKVVAPQEQPAPKTPAIPRVVDAVPQIENTATTSAVLPPSAATITATHSDAQSKGLATKGNATEAVSTLPLFDADYLDNPAPQYPALSRRTNEQGKVLLHVYVSASGLAEKVELYTSSGYTRLDQAALAAVARWKFVPAKKGVDSVSAWVFVPIIFSLKV